MLDYQKQQVLIIDDFPEFRMSLRGLMQQLGCQDIDIAADGETAIKLCRTKGYDIILSDYNLGDGKDGQQVLEELASRDYLKPAAVFVIVTAENTTEMVMAALEHTPDAYLTKPFTQDLLKKRLDKLLAKKLCLEPINKAVMTRNYPKALRLADKVIASEPKYAMACMRIKAELFMRMADLNHAQAIFEQVLASRPIPWALTGLGKLKFAQQQYEQSEACFQKLLQQIPNYPEALEWLGRIRAIDGHYTKAQELLQAATSVCPKISHRQQRLGDLARINQDYEVAKRAYRAAIKHSKDSVHHIPDTYLNLVGLLTEDLTSKGGIKNKRLSSEALAYLKTLEQEFANDQEIKLRACISRHAIYHKLGRKELSEKYMSLAKDLFNELQEQASGATTTDMAGAYLREQDYEQCQALLTRVLEKFGDDQDILASVELMIDDKGAFDRAVEASRINSKGVLAHSNNDLAEAVSQFRQAVNISPENISFKMNLIQALISQCEVSHETTELVAEIEPLLDSMAVLNNRDYRYIRYQQLQRMLNDIRIGHTGD